MQLILETESTDVSLIDGKMSVDQESVNEKITNGDVQSNGTGDVLKADKENKECNENIITSEIITSSDTKNKTSSVEEINDQQNKTDTSNTCNDVSAKENVTVNGASKDKSQKEDTQLENNTPVTSQNICYESKNDTDVKEMAVEKEDNLESSQCNNTEEDSQVSIENKSSGNTSSDEINENVLDEPLRFEDDDNSESNVAENWNSEEINPAASKEIIDAPVTESDLSDNQTRETKSEEQTNELTLETQKTEIDSIKPEKKKTVSPENQKNDVEESESTDSTETNKITDLIEIQKSASTDTELTEIKKIESDPIEIQKNDSSNPNSTENQKNESDSIEIENASTDTDLNVTKKHEISLIEMHTNESKPTVTDIQEELTTTITTQKEDEIEANISENAMESDISVEAIKAETISDVHNSVNKIEETDVITTNNDGHMPASPMECDDIVNTSQDKEIEDKQTDLSEMDVEVLVTDSKIDNDNVEVPSVTEEPSVTGSDYTVSNKSFKVSATEYKDITLVTDTVCNGNEFIDESLSHDNKKSPIKNKIIGKVTVEVPDSSTECNDISIMSDDVEQVKDKSDAPVTVDLDENEDQQDKPQQIKETKVIEKLTEPVCRLSNNLNILSDDEDESSKEQKEPKSAEPVEKCIDLVDDDDIVLIDEDTTGKNEESLTKIDRTDSKMEVESSVNATNFATGEPVLDKEPTEQKAVLEEPKSEVIPDEKTIDVDINKLKKSKPLLPKDFFKSYKKNLAEMTRNELEEFCILKIVESIIDRSKLNDIRTKLQSMTSHIEEHKKKAQALSKQNRDLQVVLKSVQEEQKKQSDLPVAPLRITRSVGMQVLMTDKSLRRKGPITATTPGSSIVPLNVNNKTNQSPRTPVRPQANRNIPVPKLVPATANAGKATTPTQTNVKNVRTEKKATSSPTAVKVQSPVKPEKRTHSQCATVDLTDDEPPSKVAQRSPAGGMVRMVAPHHLIKNTSPATTSNASPRKVYIPIVQGQVRPGQMMVKNGPSGPRPRGQHVPMVRVAQFAARPNRISPRHPAPLPDTTKQYQPPNWKSLPPAPDLKLSKVENGIVISWKIEGYLEDSYEEIASYQLYAYQETTAPPNTALWKKIGDVKALPLPMACTLTQFMAGYKYYFAVRAVDIRSRLGPFSLPGSILLLNKNF